MVNNVAAALGDAAKLFEVGLFDEHGTKNREVLFFHQQFGDDSVAQFIDLLGRQCFIHRISPQALIRHRHRYLSYHRRQLG